MFWSKHSLFALEEQNKKYECHHGELLGERRPPSRHFHDPITHHVKARCTYFPLLPSKLPYLYTMARTVLIRDAPPFGMFTTNFVLRRDVIRFRCVAGEPPPHPTLLLVVCGDGELDVLLGLAFGVRHTFVHFVPSSSILLGNSAGCWPCRRVPVPHNHFAVVPCLGKHSRFRLEL